MRAASLAIFMLWVIGATNNLTLGREGGVAVNCRRDVITLHIPEIESLTSRLGVTAVLVGDQSGHTCTVHKDYGKIKLHHPFRMCGTKVALSGDGVVISNTIWLWKATEGLVKFADVRCKYGTRFEEPTQPQLTALEQRPTGTLQSEVGLCKTPTYCPNRACPYSESLADQAIYFDRSVMYLSIKLSKKGTRHVSAEEFSATITKLILSCGVNPLRSTAEYYSVSDGCRTYGSSYGDRRKALYTQVEYNVQSDTICISVDVPPSNVCPIYYLHGEAIQCNRTYETKCDDYSGSKCSSPSAEKGEFVYGPIYVFGGNQTEGIVSYHSDYTESTTTVDDSSLGGIHGKVEMLQPLPKGGSDTDSGDKRSEPHDNVGEVGKNQPTSVESKLQAMPVLDFDTTLPTTSHSTGTPPTLKLPVASEEPKAEQASSIELVDFEQIAEDKVLENPLFDIIDVTPFMREEFEEDKVSDIEESRLLSAKSVNSKKIDAESTKRDSKPGRKISKNQKPSDIVEIKVPVTDREFVIEQAILDIVLDHEKDSPSQSDRKNTISVTTHASHRLTSVLPTHPSLEQPSLGKYRPQSAKDGFIWGGVSALGVFLLASIGLLVAWTATRRMRRRRMKSKREF